MAVLLVLAAATCARGQAPRPDASPMSALGAAPALRRSPPSRHNAAANSPCSLSLAVGTAFLGNQDAGLRAPPPPTEVEARPKPYLYDAFDEAFAASLIPTYRFTAAAAMFADCGVLVFPGRRRSEGYLGDVKYSPMTLLSMEVGLHFSAPFDLPWAVWFKQGVTPRNKGFEPYLRVSVGLCYRDRVALRPVGGYWRASTVFSASLIIGVEFGTSSIGLFVEGGVRYVSEPVETVWFAEADPAILFPLRAGVRVYF